MKARGPLTPRPASHEEGIAGAGLCDNMAPVIVMPLVRVSLCDPPDILDRVAPGLLAAAVDTVRRA